LHFLGTGFDCASQAELEEVKSIGVKPEHVIYANPCKGKEHLTFAKSNGFDLMTFDNASELQKVISIHPTAKLVLRILPDDRYSLMPFGTKFGASFEESCKLISCCKELGASLVGVSFHVGSGCYSSQAWHDAIRLARRVFDEAEKAGFKLSTLDIGGVRTILPLDPAWKSFQVQNDVNHLHLGEQNFLDDVLMQLIFYQVFFSLREACASD